MSDTIVSIRMPNSLASKLKILSKKKNFLDLSEMIRSIVRNKWIEASSQELMQVKKLRADISEELKKKTMDKVRQELVQELEKIKKELKND